MTLDTVPARPGRSLRSRPGRVVIAAAALLVAGGTVWGLTSSERSGQSVKHVELRTAGVDGWKAGAALPSTRVGQAYTFGAIPVCVTSPGAVVIDAIRPSDPTGGLQVTGFATRPVSGDLFGADQVTLSAAGFTDTAHEVGSACGPDKVPDEVAVEVRKAGATNARTGELLADWHSSTDKGTLTIPFHIVLCQGSDTSTAACPPW